MKNDASGAIRPIRRYLSYRIYVGSCAHGYFHFVRRDNDQVLNAKTKSFWNYVAKSNYRSRTLSAPARSAVKSPTNAIKID